MDVKQNNTYLQTTLISNTGRVCFSHWNEEIDVLPYMML